MSTHMKLWPCLWRCVGCLVVQIWRFATVCLSWRMMLPSNLPSNWEFPNLVVLNQFNLVVCNFYAEALFYALLRAFADFQKNPRVRKISVRNSGARDGCANVWTPGKMRPFCRKSHVHKIPRFRGGGVFWVWGGGGSADFIFMGAGIFLRLGFALFCVHLRSFARICVFLRPTAPRTTALGKCRSKVEGKLGTPNPPENPAPPNKSVRNPLCHETPQHKDTFRPDSKAAIFGPKQSLLTVQKLDALQKMGCL